MRRLADVVPGLRSRAITLLRLMAAHGHPMVVVSARRTRAEQAALYAQGRTKPGKRVTQLDGSPGRESRHQQGRAVDCAFAAGPGQVSWEGPWELYMTVAETLGLVAGGRWKRFPDRPHVELPADMADDAL